jgi:hypothetical protein
MAAVKSTSPIGSIASLSPTKVLDVLGTVNVHTRNLRNGPTTVRSFKIKEEGAAKVWLKVYDNVSTTLVAGTTAPDFGFPVAASGSLLVECPGGFFFENGISVLGSNEDGNAITAPTTMNVRILSS